MWPNSLHLREEAGVQTLPAIETVSGPGIRCLFATVLCGLTFTLLVHGQTTVERYFPIAKGVTWEYQVQLPQDVRLPYQPTFEVPEGLLCTSIHCGRGSWNAGQIAFSVSVGDQLSSTADSTTWRASLDATALKFYFYQVDPPAPARASDFELRVKDLAGDTQLELVLIQYPEPPWRLVRPLIRLSPGDLSEKLTVSVPAGAFHDVVKSNLVLQGDGSNLVGTWTTEIFLAPDVGMIKAIGKDPAGVVLYTLELTTFTGAGPSVVTSVSAASYAPGGMLAAESIASGFGQGLATATEAATVLPLPTTLADSTVEVKDSAGTGRLAPLFFVSPGQINYTIPAGTQTGLAAVTVRSGGQTVATGAVQIDLVAPGLFSANGNGRDVAAAWAIRVAADGSQSSQLVFQCGTTPGSCVLAPIDLGPETEQAILMLFGTGIRGRSTLAGVTATIGGTAAEVQYAGPQGDYVGRDQVNVRVPRSLAGQGDVDIVLTVDGKTANVVTMNIQ